MKRNGKFISYVLSLCIIMCSLMMSAGTAYADETTDSLFYDKTPISTDEYAYSFAVVGDTQVLSWTQSGEEYRQIFKWLVDNKEEKKIKHVFHVGDITEERDTGKTEQLTKEWTLAKEAISQLDGEIPYMLVRGNHDLSTWMNEYLGTEEYYAQFEGVDHAFQTVGTIENMYRTFTVNNTDYLFMVLKHAPSDLQLQWASRVVKTHPYHRVIIATHAYIDSDGTLLTTGDDTDSGTDIWDKFASQHSNVNLILCGHVATYDIVMSTNTGVNGNKVTQILNNPQGMDKDMYYAGESPLPGMVMMMYFSEDGSVVNVEYYSTVKEKYYNPENQFAFTLNVDDTTPDYVETKYGKIPAEYDDPDAYPFLLFNKEGGFRGGFADYGEFLKVAPYDVTGESVLWLRADHETNYTSSSNNHRNLTRLGGKLTIDLDGHTFTRGSNHMFALQGVSTKDNTVEIDVINGTIDAGKSVPVVFNDHADSTVKENYIVNFNNVNFTRSTAGSNSIVVTYADGGKAAGNLTFNNCKFDLTNMTGSTLFRLKDNNASNKIDVQVALNGCEFSSTGDVSDIILATRDARRSGAQADSDTVKFDNGAGIENKTTLIIPEGTTTETELMVCQGSTGKIVSFANPAQSGENVVYTATEYDGYLYVETKYGNVDSAYADTAKYPFLLFSAGGEFLKAYADFGAFLTDTNNIKTEAILLLRTNYTTNYTKTSNNDRNLVKLKNKLTLDLDGHTITRGTQHMFQFFGTYKTDKSTKMEIINGTVDAGSQYPVVFNDGSASTVNEYFDVTFRNVTFMRSTKTGKGLMTVYGDGGANSGVVTFDKCKFDLTNFSGGTIFDMKDLKDANLKDYSVVLTECEFVSGKDVSPITLVKCDDARSGESQSPDSITIDDKTTLTIAKNSNPDAVMTTSCGTNKFIGFFDAEISDDKYVYTLDMYESAEETVNGAVVPAQYTNADKYPFLLFNDETGEFTKAYGSWHNFLFNAANTGADSTLVLRRDYGTDEDITLSLYDNAACRGFYKLAHNLVIDLNGYTMNKETRHLFLFFGGSSSDSVSNITIRNGKVNNDSDSFAPVYFQKNASAGNSTFNVEFDNVSFTVTPGVKLGTGGASVISSGVTGSPAALTIGNVVFTDCTFDVTGNAASNRAIFGLEAVADCNNISVVVNGGNIISEATIPVLFNGDDGDSLKFGTNESGNYTTLTVPAGVKPELEVITADGKTMRFGLVVESNADNTVYTLNEYTASSTYTIGDFVFDRDNARVEISVKVENSEEYPFTVVLAEKTGNKLVQIKLGETVYLTGADGEQILGVTLDEELTEGSTLAAYLWESMDTVKPYVKPCDFK